MKIRFLGLAIAALLIWPRPARSVPRSSPADAQPCAAARRVSAFQRIPETTLENLRRLSDLSSDLILSKVAFPDPTSPSHDAQLHILELIHENLPSDFDWTLQQALAVPNPAQDDLKRLVDQYSFAQSRATPQALRELDERARQLATAFTDGRMGGEELYASAQELLEFEIFAAPAQSKIKFVRRFVLAAQSPSTRATAWRDADALLADDSIPFADSPDSLHARIYGLGRASRLIAGLPPARGNPAIVVASRNFTRIGRLPVSGTDFFEIILWSQAAHQFMDQYSDEITALLAAFHFP